MYVFVCFLNIDFFCKAASNVGPYELFLAACPCMLFIDIIYLFINWANKDACLLACLLAKAMIRHDVHFP